MNKIVGSLCILIGAFCHADAPLVRVQSYVRVFDSEPLSLLSIVDKNELPLPLRKQLAHVKLGSAPKIGEKREFTSQAIAGAIRAANIKKSWNIQIPYEVTVENKGYEMDHPSVEKQLLSTWQSQCAECEIKILNLQLPVLADEHKVSPWALMVDPRMPRGNFSSQMVVTVNPSKKLSYWINGQIEVYKKVPVLNRSTPMNTRLTDEDVQFEVRNITQATDSVATLKSLVGQKAKYTMNAGDIIWSQSLMKEKAVQRGEIVKVSIGEDNWDVSIQAQTEQDGYVGDTVNLKNLQTNRTITGRVVDIGKVDIK